MGNSGANARVSRRVLDMGYRLLGRRLDDAFERRFMRCSVSVVRGCFLTYSRETKRPSTAFRSKVISIAIASAPFCGSLNFGRSRRAMPSNHLWYAVSKHFTSALWELLRPIFFRRAERRSLHKRTLCEKLRRVRDVSRLGADRGQASAVRSNRSENNGRLLVRSEGQLSRSILLSNNRSVS